MKVQAIFERNDFNQEEKIDIVQCVYDNCWASETILYNTMSDISSACNQRGMTSEEKIEYIKERALTALDRSKEQNMRNPDIHNEQLKKVEMRKKMLISRRIAKRIINGRV